MLKKCEKPVENSNAFTYREASGNDEYEMARFVVLLMKEGYEPIGVPHKRAGKIRQVMRRKRLKARRSSTNVYDRYFA